jgi:hypothetical protein
MNCVEKSCLSPFPNECDALGQCSIVIQMETLQKNTYPGGMPLTRSAKTVFLIRGWIAEVEPGSFAITEAGRTALASF